MNKISLAVPCCRFLVIVLAVFSLHPAYANDDAHNMVCRAGPGMQFHLTPTPRGYNYTLDIQFAKARRGFEVDPAGLEPGQCAWLDRAITREEPWMARYWLANIATDEERRSVGYSMLKKRRGHAVFRRHFTVSIARNENGVSVRFSEPDTSSARRPFKRLSDFEILDGKLFTIRAKVGKAVPRRGVGWNTKAPVFIVSHFQQGGVLNDGTVLQVNDRGQVYIARKGVIETQTRSEEAWERDKN